MKLLFLLYLEDDDPRVTHILAEQEVQAFSRLPVEGHRGARTGWLGETSPFRSKMIFTLVSDEKAEAVMRAVSRANDLHDATHPIHGIQVAVEAVCRSGVPFPNVGS